MKIFKILEPTLFLIIYIDLIFNYNTWILFASTSSTDANLTIYHNYDLPNNFTGHKHKFQQSYKWHTGFEPALSAWKADVLSANTNATFVSDMKSC